MSRSPEQRRSARESRRRTVRRQRRALALLLTTGAVLSIVLLATGSRSQPPTDGASHRALRPLRVRPSAVDRALSYTNYLFAGAPRRREVALTFDDGPGPYTEPIMRTLRRARAGATFFPVGRPIAAFPQILRRERRAGFPIGDHTFAHPLMGHRPPEIQAGEIDEQARIVTREGGAYPRMFRPPYGSFDSQTLRLLHQRRMLMVLWSVNPQDYFRPGVAQIVRRVMAAVRPGSVVLMHDGGGDRSQTAAALPIILRRLQARHLVPVTVPRLLEDDPPAHGQPPPPNLAGV